MVFKPQQHPPRTSCADIAIDMADMPEGQKVLADSIAAPFRAEIKDTVHRRYLMLPTALIVILVKTRY